jgi:phage gpG-like protein
MKTKVTDKDLGWKAIAKQLQRDASVTIGIRGDQNNSRTDGPATNVEIATVHEFGGVVAIDGKAVNVPRRSFLRDTVDLNEARYIALIGKMKTSIFTKTISSKQALSVLGQAVKADMINRINAGIPPANSEITIERKGSSTTLIDTGQLKKSITYEVST